MIEPSNIWQIFCHYRHNIGLGFVATLMCVLRHVQLQSSWRATFTSSVMCGVVAFGIDEFMSSMFGLSGKSSYFIAVIIGYMGIDVIISHIDWLRKPAPNQENDKE